MEMATIYGLGQLTLTDMNDVKASSTAPVTPSEGALWYNTNENQLYVYKGGQWLPSNNTIIGGRNLIRKSYLALQDATGSFDDATNTWTINTTSGVDSKWGAGLKVITKNVQVPIGSYMSISFEIFTPVDINWMHDVNNFFVNATTNGSNDNDDQTFRKNSTRTIKANTWTKVWFQYKGRDNATDIMYDNSVFGIINETGSAITYQIRNVQGELGNIITGFTPAPEDVQEQIDDIGETVTDITETLGNMANDDLLDYEERKVIKDKISEIIGYVMPNTDTGMLPVATLDANGKGAFYEVRKSALMAGLSTTDSKYVNVATQYTALKTYLDALTPIKPWNVDGSTKDTVISVTKATFRTRWLDYYNAVSDLAIATAEKLKQNVDNVVVGNTNYISNGDFRIPLDKSLWKDNYQGQVKEIVDISTETPPFKYALHVNNTSNAVGGIFTPILFSGQSAEALAGKQLTISYWLKYQNIVQGANEWNGGRFGELVIQGMRADGTYVYSYPKVGINKGKADGSNLSGTNMTWDKYYGTISLDIPSGATKITAIQFKHGIESGTGEFWTTGIQAELGNKVTDFSPSPEDVQDRLTKAEFLLTDESITQRVTESNKYKADIGGLQSSIDNISVGARNLITNSGNFKDTTDWIGNGGSGLAVVQKDGFACLTATGSYRHKDFSLENDTNYVYTAEVMFNTDVAINHSTPLHYWVGTYVNGSLTSTPSGLNGTPQIIGGNRVLKANTWNRVSIKFKTKATDSVGFRPMIYKASMTETWWLKNIKLEKGTIPTDWTPAIEDTNKDISTLAERTTTVESKVTTDAITLVVNSNTKWGEKANTTDVYTKEELAQMTTAQLIHNTDFKKYTTAILVDNWVVGTNWTLDANKGYEGGSSMKVNASGLTVDSWQPLYSEYIPAVAGEVFTGSAYFNTDDRSTDVEGRGWSLEIEYWNATARITASSKPSKPSANGVWERFSITGTAPSGTTRVRLRMHAVRNGSFWVAKPMLTRGSVLTKWTPHIDELATELSSKISVQDGRIGLVVSSDNKIKAEQIASELAITPNAMALISPKIDLTGLVTFNSFDSTTKNTINAKADTTAVNTAIGTAVSNVKIGGTNLVKYTDFNDPNAVSKWFPFSNSTTTIPATTNVTMGTGDVLKFLTVRSITPGQTKGTQFGYASSNGGTYFSTVSGQEYTLSFLVAVHANANGNLDWTYLLNEGGTNQKIPTTSVSAMPVYGTMTSPWALNVYKYSVTFTANTTSSKVRLLIGSTTSADFTGTNNYGLFYVRDVKLEEGNKSTAWSPSPLDVNELISTAQTSANNAQGTADNAQDKIAVNTDTNNYNPNPSFMGGKNTYYTHAVAYKTSAGTPKEYAGLQTTRDNYISDYFSVVAGEKYYVEAMVNCSADANFPFGIGLHTTDETNTNNTWMPNATAQTGNTVWRKISTVITIPANRTKARFFSQINNSVPEGTSSAIVGSWFFTDVKIFKVLDDTVIGSSGTWNTGVATANTAKTTADNAKSTADTAKGILTNFDSSIINANPIFLDWSGAIPTGYTSANSTTAKVASGNGMGNAVKYTVTAGSNNFLSPSIVTTAPYSQYLTLETTFMLESGTIDGAGVLVRVNGTSNIDNKVHFKDHVPSPTLGKWYTVTKVIKMSSVNAIAGFSGHSVFPMGGWTSFGTVTAKTIQFDSVKVWASTEQEIKSYESSATVTANSGFWTQSYNTVSNWSATEGGRTVVDGDWMKTGSIQTQHLGIGDFTNYASWQNKGDSTTMPWNKNYATPDTSQFRTAVASVKLVAGRTGVELNSPIAVQGAGADKIGEDVEGDTIYYEFWVKTDSTWNGTGNNSKFRIGDQSGNHLLSVPYNGVKTTWTKFSGKYKVPTGITALRISIGNDGTTGNVWIDDVIILKTLKGELLVDGKISGVTIESVSSIDANNYTVIKGAYIESRGKFTRTWQGKTTSNDVKLKHENGYFRARNDTLNRSLYMSDFGVGTTIDGSETSGLIEFFSDQYYPQTDTKGITMYSQSGIVGLVSRYNKVQISPEWDNKGNNTFSFQIIDGATVSDTDGLILFGSHVNGFSAGIRIAKSGKENTIYATDGKGAKNGAKFSAKEFNATDKVTVGGTEVYVNGSGSGTLLAASNPLRAGGVRTTGADLYLGVDGTNNGEAIVTNLSGWNNGNGISYRPIRASGFPTGSSIQYKTNVTSFSDDEAYYILDNTDVFTYHLKSNLESRVYDKPKIGVIAEMIPQQIRDQDGVDPYSISSLNLKVSKMHKKRIESLESEVAELREMVYLLLAE